MSVAFIMLATAFTISRPEFRIALSGTDFRGQYTGLFMIKNGITKNLYGINEQYQWQKKFLPELTRDQLMVFSYHPLVALLLSPLGHLSFGNAYRVAIVINFVLLLWLLRICGSILDPKNTDRTNNVLLSAFAFFPPVWFALLQNQFSFILFILYFFVWKSLKERKFTKAGLLLSLFVIKPHMLLVILAVFVLVKQIGVIKGFIIGLTISSAVTVLLFGVDGVMQYVNFLALLSRAGDSYTIHTAAEPTIKGAMHWIAQTDRLPIWMSGLYLAIFAGFILRLTILKRYADRARERYDVWFGAIILATLLTSPHTNYHDLTLIFFSLVLIVRYGLKGIAPHLLNLPKTKKFTWYMSWFGICILCVGWVFYPPFAVVCIVLLYAQSDYLVRTGRLYPFTKRSIPKRK